MAVAVLVLVAWNLWPAWRWLRWARGQLALGRRRAVALVGVVYSVVYAVLIVMAATAGRSDVVLAAFAIVPLLALVTLYALTFADGVAAGFRDPPADL